MAKFFEVTVKEGPDMQTWYVNADAIRYFRQTQATKATLVFDREHRLDVQDSIGDLYARLRRPFPSVTRYGSLPTSSTKSVTSGLSPSGTSNVGVPGPI